METLKRHKVNQKDERDQRGLEIEQAELSKVILTTPVRKIFWWIETILNLICKALQSSEIQTQILKEILRATSLWKDFSQLIRKVLKIRLLSLTLIMVCLKRKRKLRKRIFIRDRETQILLKKLDRIIIRK